MLTKKQKKKKNLRNWYLSVRWVKKTEQIVVKHSIEFNPSGTQKHFMNNIVAT